MFTFLAGHLISIGRVLGVFSWLLFVIGGLLTFYAIQIGFGAVLLTRTGRRREYYPSDEDATWEDAMRVDVDDSGAEAAPNALRT